jgi:hypothetical protein
MRIALIAVVLLTGCISPEYRAQQALEKHGPYCEKLGFQSATDAWRNCIVQREGQSGF